MTAPHQLTPGALFGGEFRIVKPLSAGGMGAVYIAEQTSTGKARALKLMHPQLVEDPRLRERFEQEARVGALVSSDHVVQVIGAGVDQATGVPWLAMELLDGEDLGAYVRRRGALSPAELFEIYRQLCHALGAAHAGGVVHRDVKPENIFLSASKSAGAPTSIKILDFGIAKVVAEAKATATATVGTPLWMAPEQTDPRAPITPAADVWSLGLIAFWILTGRVYWKSASDPLASMQAVLREILLEPMPSASQRAAEFGCADRIPPGFDAWFRLCVEREPTERYANANDALAALRGALPAVAMTAITLAPPISTGPNAYAPTMAISGAVGTPHTPGSTGVAFAQSTAKSPGHDAPAPKERGRRSPVLILFAGAGGLAFTAGALMFALGYIRFGADGSSGTTPSQAQATSVTATAAPPMADGTTAPQSTTTPPSSKTSKSTSPIAPATATATAAPAGGGTGAKPFDVAAAHAAVQKAGGNAKFHCQGKEGPQAVTATVFFNPNGAVQRVSMDPMIAGKPSALCVSMMLSSARVQPFDGNQLQSVTTTVGIQ